MKLDARFLAAAAAVVAAASFTICAVMVTIAPAATTAFFSYVMHIDLTGLTRSLSWSSFFGGLLIVSTIVGLHVGATAWLYNLLVGGGDRGPAASPRAARRS